MKNKKSTNARKLLPWIMHIWYTSDKTVLITSKSHGQQCQFTLQVFLRWALMFMSARYLVYSLIVKSVYAGSASLVDGSTLSDRRLSAGMYPGRPCLLRSESTPLRLSNYTHNVRRLIRRANLKAWQLTPFALLIIIKYQHKNPLRGPPPSTCGSRDFRH